MIRVAIRAACLVVSLLAFGADAQTVAVTRSATGAVVEFRLANGKTASWDIGASEAIIRFGAPVEGFDLAALMREASPWIESASAGFDSVLLRVAPGVAIALRPGPNGPIAEFSAAPFMAGDRAAERRLEQIRARLEAETGKAEEAEARLAALARAAPEDVDVMIQRAGVAERLGHWSRALSLYDQAASRRPDDPELRQARQRLARERQAQARIEPDFQRVHGGDRQWMLRGSSFLYPQAGRIAGAAAEARHLSDGNTRRLDGGSGPADLWREKAELYYGVDVGSGGTVVGRLLASTGTPGAGGEYALRGGGLDIKFGAAIHEAYWDIKEAIPARGTVDKVYGRAQWQALESVTLSGGLSGNRYGVRDDVDVARTVKWDGALRRSFRLGDDEASVGYGIDAETVGHRDQRIDRTGAAFRPLPLRSRETHSLDLTLRHEFSFETWVAVQGGWSYDRLTDAKGPLANLRFSHEPTETVEVGFKLGYAHTTGRGSDGLLRTVGAFLVKRF
jgi:tetratricopeptide (TPR) repeat protein